jgi:ribosomal protein L34
LCHHGIALRAGKVEVPNPKHPLRWILPFTDDKKAGYAFRIRSSSYDGRRLIARRANQ